MAFDVVLRAGSGFDLTLSSSGAAHDSTQTDDVGITDSLSVAHTSSIADSGVGITDTGQPVVDHSVGSTNHDRTQTDDIGLTEVVAVASAHVDAVTDTSDLTDDLAILHSTPIADAGVGLTDTGIVVDEVPGSTAHDRTQTDDIGLTDTRAVASAHVRAVIDSIGLTDAQSVVAGKFVSVTDSVGLTDTRTFARQVSASDAVGVTDNLSLTLARSVNVTDAIGLTDAVSGGALLTRESADAIGVSDDLVLTQVTTITDAGVGITDTSQPDVVLTPAGELFTRTATDAIGVTDDLSTTHTTPVADTGVGITDSLTVDLGGNDFTRTATDSAGVVDDLGVTKSSPIADAGVGITDADQIIDVVDTQTDAAGITDTTTVVSAHRLTISDPVGLTDAPSGSHTIVLSDTVGLTDSDITAGETPIEYRNRIDAVGVTDSTVVAIDRALTVTDGVGLTDSAFVDEPPALLRDATDEVGLTDDTSLARTVAVSDPVLLTDAVQAVTIHTVQIADAVGVTDSAYPSYQRTITDTVGGQDEVAVRKGGGGVSTTSDDVALTDEVMVSISRVVTVEDLLDVIDTLSLSNPHLFVGVEDVLTLTEAFGKQNEDRTWRFITPTMMEGLIGGGRVLPRGVSVLVRGTEVTERRWPTVQELETCDAYYLGGRVAILSEEEAQVLIDAGYAASLEPII